jgi:hypothetical protein
MMNKAAETGVQAMLVSPELARAWLKGNTHNRPLLQLRVDDLRGRFDRGEWMLSPDAIAIAPDGMIINGQHRLTMIAQLENGHAGAMLHVFTGAPKELQRVIDQQLRRNFGQSLFMDSEKNHTILAAAAAWIYWYDSGNARKFRGRKSTGPSQQQLYETLAWHPGLRKATAWQQNIDKSERILMGPPAVLVAIHNMTHRADIDKGEAFMELVVGSGLGVSEPIVTLRRKLMAAKIRAGGTVALDTWVIFTYYVKTWNAYCDDKDLRVLRLGNTEATPKMRGYEPPLKETPAI